MRMMSTKATRFAVSFLLVSCLIGASPYVAAEESPAQAAYQTKNYREAMRLYRPLAEQGNPEAQYFVGRMYEKGQGVRKDQNEVVKWYRKSAEGGYAAAQYRLAVGYAYGLAGLSKDQDEAGKWLRRAAEGGHKKAQKYLSRAYAEGRYGFPVDEKQAEYWAQKAEANS